MSNIEKILFRWVLCLLYLGCEHVKRDLISLINNYMWLLAFPWGRFYRSMFLFEVRIILLWYLTIFTFFHYLMAAILEFCIKMKSKHQINIWFESWLSNSSKKCIYTRLLVPWFKTKFFQNGVGGHFWFWPLEKIARIFGRDMEAKFLTKGPKKSNQASNLTSQRMVTESRFMTQLIAPQRILGRPIETKLNLLYNTYARNSFLEMRIFARKFAPNAGECTKCGGRCDMTRRHMVDGHSVNDGPILRKAGVGDNSVSQ